MATYKAKHYKRRGPRLFPILVVLLLLLLLAAAIIGGVYVLKKRGYTFALPTFSFGSKQVVYQLHNPNAYVKGEVVALEAAPYADEQGIVFVPAESFGTALGLVCHWDAAQQTVTFQTKDDTVTLQVGSTAVQRTPAAGKTSDNDDTTPTASSILPTVLLTAFAASPTEPAPTEPASTEPTAESTPVEASLADTLAAAPVVREELPYLPVESACAALGGWQSQVLDAASGDFILLSSGKKPLSEKKAAKLTQKALTALGPSQAQLAADSILLRVDSDKLARAGETLTMQAADTDGTAGNASAGGSKAPTVVAVNGLSYVPLQAAVNALGGTATFTAASNEWGITYEDITNTLVPTNPVTFNGKATKDPTYLAFTDDTTHVFYVSAPLLSALLGKSYTDLGDGTAALTAMSLEGFAMQQAYLRTLQDSLTAPVTTTLNVPEADVYVALTFDDGPTGATDTYPNGYTATLLDELKKRNVHATFFMCGYRIKDFHGHMARYLEEGHELGNHTMNHPMEHLTGLDADSIREEVQSNSELIESYTGQLPTVMRPVGGGANATVKEQMQALGLPIINWSLDTRDWETKTDPDSVKDHIVNEVKDGDIILMHDLWQGTLPGVLAAIDELQSRTDTTYAFVTVSELAAIHHITLEPGMVYHRLSSDVADAIADGSYQEILFD